MAAVLETILRLSLCGSLLAAALLLLRPVLRRHIPHAVSYYLWLIVLLRLCVPVGWTLPVPDWTVEPVQHITIPVQQNDAQPVTSPLPPSESVAGTDTAPPVATINAPQTSMQQISIWNILFLIWCGGAAVCALRYLIGYRRFVRHILRGTVPTTPQASDVWDTLPHNPHIRLLCSTTAQTPLLMGAVRPTVVLPAGITDTAVLRDILRHELVHARRGDVLYKWFVAAVSCVHWFNPLMMAVRREIGRACELSCDAAVLRRADSAARKQYGQTLLLLAQAPQGTVLAAALCEETTSLKERLVSIVKHEKTTPAALLLSFLLIAALGGCALINETETASSSALGQSALIEDAKIYSIGDNMKIAIPNPILEQLHIERGYGADNFHLISLYEKQSYDDSLATGVTISGRLFSIERCNQTQYEAYLAAFPHGQYGSDVFAKDDSFYYFLSVPPTDQFYRKAVDEFTEEMKKPWNDLNAETEHILNDFIVRNGLTPYSSDEFYNRAFVYDSDHVYVHYQFKRGYTLMMLSQPAKQGAGGIWCVETSREYNEKSVYPTQYHFPHDGDKDTMSVYRDLQKRADTGERADLLNPLTAALDWLNNDGGYADIRVEQLTLLSGTPAGYVTSTILAPFSDSGTLESLDADGHTVQSKTLQAETSDHNLLYNDAQNILGGAVWMAAETTQPSGPAVRYTTDSGDSVTYYETDALLCVRSGGGELRLRAAAEFPRPALREALEWDVLL